MSDQYNSITEKVISDIRIKNSKFIGYAFPCNDITQFEQVLYEVKKEHPKATHHCFAYRIGYPDFLHRFNDDGEPSGTAGKPMYGAILSKDFYDVAVIVVRYYGGTKLGTSGLIQAYKESAAEALNQAQVVLKTISEKFKIEFDYGVMGELLNELKSAGIEIVDKTLDEKPSLTIQIPVSKVEEKILLFKAKFLKVSLEEVDMKTKLNGISIAKI